VSKDKKAPSAQIGDAMTFGKECFYYEESRTILYVA
jgi:hypothetical protein